MRIVNFFSIAALSGIAFANMNAFATNYWYFINNYLPSSITDAHRELVGISTFTIDSNQKKKFIDQVDKGSYSVDQLSVNGQLICWVVTQPTTGTAVKTITHMYVPNYKCQQDGNNSISITALANN